MNNLTSVTLQRETEFTLFEQTEDKEMDKLLELVKTKVEGRQ